MRIASYLRHVHDRNPQIFEPFFMSIRSIKLSPVVETPTIWMEKEWSFRGVPPF
jgi:hypothetical protein